MQTREIYNQEDVADIAAAFRKSIELIKSGESSFICNTLQRAFHEKPKALAYFRANKPSRKQHIEFYKHHGFIKKNMGLSWWDWGDCAYTKKARMVSESDAMKEKVRFLKHLIKQITNDNTRMEQKSSKTRREQRMGRSC